MCFCNIVTFFCLVFVCVGQKVNVGGEPEWVSNSALAMCISTGGMSTRGNLVRTVLFPNPIKFQFGAELSQLYVRMSIIVALLFILQLIFVNQVKHTRRQYSNI